LFLSVVNVVLVKTYQNRKSKMTDLSEILDGVRGSRCQRVDQQTNIW
jgi:hypothetical protein